MPYTMEDFNRDYVKKTMKRFAQLTPEQRREALESLPSQQRLAGLSEEQIRQYLDKLAQNPSPAARKPRQKR